MSFVKVLGATWDVSSTEAKLLAIGTDLAESLTHLWCLAPSMWDFKAAFPMLANLNSRQHSLQYAACLSPLTTCNQSLYAPFKTQSELKTHLPPPGIFNKTNVLTNPRNSRQHIQDGVHLTTWWKNLIPECNVRKSDFNPACKGTGREEIFRKIFSQVWSVRSILELL